MRLQRFNSLRDIYFISLSYVDIHVSMLLFSISNELIGQGTEILRNVLTLRL